MVFSLEGERTGKGLLFLGVDVVVADPFFFFIVGIGRELSGGGGWQCRGRGGGLSDVSGFRVFGSGRIAGVDVV